MSDSLNTPPKVLRVITRLNIGGPAIHVVLLTRDLRGRGYTTRLVTGVCEESDGDMSYLLQSDDPVTFVPHLSRSVKLVNNLKALIELLRIIRAERPHIVHTHTAMAGCIGRTAAILARVPVVVHTFHGNSLREYFSPAASALFLRIERLLARFTDAICVISEQQLRELGDEFQIAPRPRFRVVPLGLDLSGFSVLDAPVLEHGCLRVGWFGRLVPVKNIPLLCDVIESTLDRSGDIEFHIAGDGPDRPLIEAAVCRFGSRVIWHGWVNDITPIVARCHLLIQTSRNEGTPVALIQGMAAGRPFVATKVGGLVDMVSGPPPPKSEGAQWYSNAILVEPVREAFAAALLRLSRDAQKLGAMSVEARALACQKYQREALAKNLDLLYKECLAKKLPWFKSAPSAA